MGNWVGVREGGVTPPAPPISIAFGQLFKDDVTGFAFRISDICFLTIQYIHTVLCNVPV
jgi:hypothetical protein